MPEPHVRQRAIAWRFPTHDENEHRLTVLVGRLLSAPEGRI